MIARTSCYCKANFIFLAQRLNKRARLFALRLIFLFGILFVRLYAVPWTGYLNFIFTSSSGWPIAFETLRKKSDVSSISKTILVDWHSGQTALSIYSLFPEPGDLKKTCAIPNLAVMYALIASWISSSENLVFGTPDTANTLRAKLPRWLHFEHRTGLSEPNFGIFIVATVSSSLSALISIAFFIACLCVMLCLLSGRTPS